MPKIPAYTLAWSSATETYELYETRDRGVLKIAPESPAWFTWLDQVSPFARQALALLPEIVGSLSYYFGLGDLLREWNELDTAEQHLTLGMAQVNEMLTVEPIAAMLGYTALARLQQARGNTREAFTTLDALAQVAEQRHFPPHLVSQEGAVRAQLELAQGNLAAAIHWADTSGLAAEDDDLHYPREGAYLALARVRIAQGRDDPAGLFIHDALRLLDRLLKDAEAKVRMGSVLEILALRALALEAHRDRTSALSILERALVLAVSEGYIRARALNLL